MKYTYFLLTFLLMSSFAMAQVVEFDEEYMTVNENDGTVDVVLNISSAPANPASVDVKLVNGIGYAINTIHFDFTDMTADFPAGETNSVTITIDINDNAIADNDRLFALMLDNPVNCTIGEDMYHTVFILNDEAAAPVASEELVIEHKNSYLVDANGSAEIVQYDPTTQRLFVLNSTATKVEILDFNDPQNITTIKSVDMTQFGDGATSVAVMNGIVAATVEGPNFTNGEVVFMDTDGNLLNDVEVGNLPDMLTFTPDGKYVLTANEGEPNDDYTIDPEGSVSVIDITGGVENLTQDDVTTIEFDVFNSQLALLKGAGVRIFGKDATVAQDLEPEYIVVSSDSKMAWVSCQENNALVEINLETMEAVDIIPLGTADYTAMNNSLDVSNRIDFIFHGNWDVRGMYMPDAVALYEVNNVPYIVTANEGDQREYGDAVDEDVNVRDDDFILDPMYYPHADLLKANHMLGRIAATPYNGDYDEDGDIDQIHVFGGRSFSIFNAFSGNMVFDSKDDFERIIAEDPVWAPYFNSTDDELELKNRSDNKGPEPEGVVTGMVNGKHYAFIGLERMGGVMTYNVTDPTNPVFVNYINTRTQPNDGGDLAPEGMIFISKENSPVNNAILVAANEVSATISVFYVEEDMNPLAINNAQDQLVCFNEDGVVLGNYGGSMLNVTGGSGDYTYNWYPAYGLDDNTKLNPILSPQTTSRDYTLTVTDNQTGDVELVSIRVIVRNIDEVVLPSIIRIEKDATVQLNGLANVPAAEAGYDFMWRDDMEWMTTLMFNEDYSYDPASRIARLYLTVVNPEGCENPEKRVIVIENSSKEFVLDDVVTGANGNSIMVAYPNPAINDINLLADFGTQGDVKVSIIDINGNTLMTFDRNNINSIDEKINVSSIPTGTYMIVVESTNDTVVKKFIKQ